jgi:REP element-mobilizing transposase RayT
MARKARIVAPGIPQRGNNRQDIFLTDDDRRFYIQTLREKSEQFGLTVLGHCVMTNHVHVVADASHIFIQPASAGLPVPARMQIRRAAGTRTRARRSPS